MQSDEYINQLDCNDNFTMYTYIIHTSYISLIDTTSICQLIFNKAGGKNSYCPNKGGTFIQRNKEWYIPKTTGAAQEMCLWFKGLQIFSMENIMDGLKDGTEKSYMTKMILRVNSCGFQNFCNKFCQ